MGSVVQQIFFVQRKGTMSEGRKPGHPYPAGAAPNRGRRDLMNTWAAFAVPTDAKAISLKGNAA